MLPWIGNSAYWAESITYTYGCTDVRVCRVPLFGRPWRVEYRYKLNAGHKLGNPFWPLPQSLPLLASPSTSHSLLLSPLAAMLPKAKQRAMAASADCPVSLPFLFILQRRLRAVLSLSPTHSEYTQKNSFLQIVFPLMKLGY